MFTFSVEKIWSAEVFSKTKEVGIDARDSFMSFKPQGDTQAALKQLWGEFVPSLTSEQADIALKLWQKIQTRKQREINQKL